MSEYARLWLMDDDFEIRTEYVDGIGDVHICLMNDGCKDENGDYEVPTTFTCLTAPNDEMSKKWEEIDENNGFSFNCVYMMRMSCGHYEVFQHTAKDIRDIVEWVKRTPVDKCTPCHFKWRD
jgi:hypothetical protein